MSIATLFQEVERAFRPTGVRVSENEESYIIEALVAGVKGKDIEISLEKGALSIQAKSERHSYSYLVPMEEIQMDETAQAEATTEDGILRVVLPKMKTSRPLKIPVKS